MVACPPKSLTRLVEFLRREFPAEQLKEAARKQTTRTIPFRQWTQKFLSKYLTCTPSEFHIWLSDILATFHQTRGQKQNILSPRGSGKSTWSTFAYPLYCAVHGIEPFIILTADTSSQAVEYLRAIRSELEDNAALADAYPDACGKGAVWKDDHIVLRNGVAIMALGTGAKLRGRRHRQHRPSLVLVDDPQNTGHIVSPLQRSRSWDWLTKDVMNAGDPATNILVLGTALHREAIVCQLRTTPGWTAKLWQSVQTWPERMDLWKDWEFLLHDYDNADRENAARRYYEANRDDMERGSKVLWPERYSLYDLMQKRASIGSAAFESEQQNNPIDPKNCEWPADYFDHAAFWFDEWPSDLAVKVLALDPSKGSDAGTGDYSAYVRYGRDGNGVEYVEADLQRRSTERIVEDGVEHVRAFKPDSFAIEANTFQSLFAPLFQQKAAQLRMELPITLVVNSINKQVRIRRLGEPLSQKRLRFKRRSPGTQLLVQQLQDFPNADHDDGGDSLEVARRVAIELVNGKILQGGRRR